MTDQFIRLKTFCYAHELAVLRGRLEAEGIECAVHDELTTQVNPFYSNAIGGVKLLVRRSRLNEALKILKDTGQMQEETSDLLPALSEFTDRIERAISSLFSSTKKKKALDTKAKTTWHHYSQN